MGKTASLLPPVLRTERGHALGAAADAAYSLEPWLACPLHIETSYDEVLWALARQFDVAGPLMQAMRTREQRERLIRNALLLQKKRGTPWSVEEIMRLIGYSDAKVLDRTNMALLYDAEAAHDGTHAFDGGKGLMKVKRYSGKGRPYDGGLPGDSGQVTGDSYGGGSAAPIPENGAGDSPHQQLSTANCQLSTVPPHVYDGVKEYYRYKWTDYRIRLCIGEGSRSFTAEDLAVAFALAEDWAPLRATLIGWDARHVVTSRVADPAGLAEGGLGVSLWDGRGASYVVPHWAMPLGHDGVALRWRMWSEELPLREVLAASLVGRDGQELIRAALPAVEAAENVIYEGIWELRKCS